MSRKNKAKSDAINEYREIPVRPAFYTMLVVVAALAAPLGWMNYKIGVEGSMIADTSRYSDLVEGVNRDVKVVQQMLDSSHISEQALKGITAPVVTLITPDVMPTNMDEAATNDSGTLKIKLSAIYWSPNDPIATINGENYHVGEFIQRHRIVEIRKTEVVFEDPMGEKVVKYFYDYLDNSKSIRK